MSLMENEVLVSEALLVDKTRVPDMSHHKVKGWIELLVKLSEEYNSRHSDPSVPKLHEFFDPLDFEILEKVDGWLPGEILNRYSRRTNSSYAVAFYRDEVVRGTVEDYARAGQLEEMAQMLMGREILAHVARLVSHKNAPACRDFGLACLKYLPEMEDECPRLIRELFPENLDGDSAAQFWTFGPYIMEALKMRSVLAEKGEGEKTAFLRTMVWMASRKELDKGSAHYPGLGDEIRINVLERMLLGWSGEHPTHKLAERVGEYVAHYLESLPDHSYELKTLLIKRVDEKSFGPQALELIRSSRSVGEAYVFGAERVRVFDLTLEGGSVFVVHNDYVLVIDQSEGWIKGSDGETIEKVWDMLATDEFWGKDEGRGRVTVDSQEIDFGFRLVKYGEYDTIGEIARELSQEDEDEVI